MTKIEVIDHRKKYGEVLKKARIALGWTQFNAARQAMISQHQVIAIEDGSRAFTFDSYIKLANALKLRVDLIKN